MSSIIIIDQMHPSIVSQLKFLGYKVDYQPEISRSQLIEIVGNYQGLIVRSKTTIDSDLLNHADNLRFVARAGAGVDNLDEKAIADRGILILNAPEGNRDTLGEHVVAMLLNILHRITEANNAIRSGVWHREGFRGTELNGRTVGVVGCGNMGKAFASRLSGFSCTVLGYDKYLQRHDTSVYQPVAIEELFGRCDIVSLHVPLTDETRGFYDYSFFQQFAKPIVLINSARGEILPLTDLVQLLKENKIIAAGLDVFENEPLRQLADDQKDTYEYIVNDPSVLLTPHVAGWSHESYERINDVLVAKISDLTSDNPLD